MNLSAINKDVIDAVDALRKEIWNRGSPTLISRNIALAFIATSADVPGQWTRWPEHLHPENSDYADFVTDVYVVSQVLNNPGGYPCLSLQVEWRLPRIRKFLELNGFNIPASREVLPSNGPSEQLSSEKG